MDWKFWKKWLGQNKDIPSVLLAEAAARESWPLRELLPATSQRRVRSRTTEECLREFHDHSENWIENCAATRSFKDRKWGAKLYADLYADEDMALPAVIQCDARKVALETLHGCARTSAGEYVVGSAMVHVSLPHSIFQKAPVKSAPDLPLFSLLASWPNNYAHWLMDVLPRLAAVNFDLEHRIALLPDSGPDFQIDSLRALGVSDGFILRAPARVVRTKDIRLIKAAAHTGVPRGDLMQRLRDRLQSSITTPSSEKRIYVSRARSKRPLVNEEAVRAYLAERGFLIVENESLSFQDQLRLYAGASLIVGAHGAGNYNLIFANPGTQLLEIYNPLYWDGAAARISGLLGIEHWHIYGKNLSDDYQTSIDLPRLENALAAMTTATPASI